MFDRTQVAEEGHVGYTLTPVDHDPFATDKQDALKILDELGHVKIVPKVPYVRFGGKLSFPFWSLIGRIQSSFLGQNYRPKVPGSN